MDKLTGLSNMDALTGISNIEFPGKGKGKGLEQAAIKFKGGFKKQGKFSPGNSLVTSTSFEPEGEVIFDPFELESGTFAPGISNLNIGISADSDFFNYGIAVVSGNIQAI
jgi:hypothetical protein